MTKEEGLNKLTQIMRAGPYEACEICGISEGVISIKLHEPKADWEYELLAEHLKTLIVPAAHVIKMWRWYPKETWHMLIRDGSVPEVKEFKKLKEEFRKAWRRIPKLSHARAIHDENTKQERHRKRMADSGEDS